MNETVQADTGGGVGVTWGAAHRNGAGELISQQRSITPSAIPTCLTFSCLVKYWKEATFYALVCNYDRRRTAYSEANRDKVILERYRTGEPFPKTIWQAIHANIKLKCPVCRRYDVDPFIRR